MSPSNRNMTIRGIDDETMRRLRVNAASLGRSMEAEARVILREALASPEEENGLGSKIHARFMALGGVDLELPERHESSRKVDFER